MLVSSEDVVSSEDSGANTFTNGSSSGGAKGFTSEVLFTEATCCTDED